MISARYAAPTAVLLVLALVPTVIHSYRHLSVDDGLRVADIPAPLAGWPSRPTDRKAVWVKNNLDADDWLEREIIVDGAPVLLFAARSLDTKKLYHHPEHAVLRGGMLTTEVGVHRVTARPELPIHVLRTEREGIRGVAAYVLVYDGEYVASPVRFQLRASAEMLVSARRPMTLLLASALRGDPDRLDEAPAVRVLLAAVSAFEAQSPSR
jgi:hypothetical protein